MGEFWKGKKVLVTGHTGFVGTWLCLVLQHLDAEVSGISLPEEDNSLYARVKNNVQMNSVYEDLRNAEEIKKYVEEMKPEIIFHLAAYGFIQECFTNPEKAYSTNVMGTFNLLEAIRSVTSVKVVIVASSDKVYKNLDEEIYYFREEDALGGLDPYSCSKAQEDLLAQSYYQSYLKQQGLGMGILRPSNILGGGDHNRNRLLPSILNCLENNTPLEIRNPMSVRPWQHILDMIDAYLYVAEHSWNKNKLSIFNVGPQMEDIITVGEIANILLELSGQEVDNTLVIDRGNAPEQNFLALSINKMEEEIGWTPKKTIFDTLSDIWQFRIKESEQGTYKACREQIERYMRSE